MCHTSEKRKPRFNVSSAVSLNPTEIEFHSMGQKLWMRLYKRHEYAMSSPSSPLFKKTKDFQSFTPNKATYKKTTKLEQK